MYYQTGIPFASKDQCLEELANKDEQQIITITEEQTITIDNIDRKLEEGDKLVICRK